MATKPRTKELCWKLIERLEKDYKTVNDAYHKLANECEVMLMEKDKAFLEKCNRCRMERAGK